MTRLRRDGLAKAGTESDKIMLGTSAGLPIMVAPITDGLGLVIAEGIEDALSGHAATGMGAWAAGCAIRLPRLAAAVPSYIEAVTILADQDPAGRQNARELARLLRLQGRDVRLVAGQVSRMAA